MCRIQTNIIIVFALLITSVSANNYCYSSGGLFAIIIASVFVTVVVISITFALIYYLWITKRLKLDFILNKTIRKDANSKKDVESVNHEYAFDNPYFKEDDDAERGANFHIANDAQSAEEENKISTEETKMPEVNKETNFKVKLRNGVLTNKDRFVKSLPPLSSVFNNVTLLSRKHKNDCQISKDDTYLTLKPERVEVELIGHDFTGLGFNICGNMRTGIFIKEVQNRGPANECGKIKTGDRIISVKVSYERMVYEDAIAILSYASPYSVCLELEKLTNYATIDKISNSKLNNRNNGVSYRSLKDKQLLHPIYRSNSFNNLSRIEKDVSLSEKSSISSSKNIFVQKIKSQIFNKKECNKQNEANTSFIVDETQKNLTVKENTEKSVDISDGQVSAVSESVANVRPDSKQFLEDSTAISSIEPSISINNKPTEVDTVVLPQSEPVVKEVENQLAVDLPAVPVVPAKRKGKAPQPPVKQELEANSSQTASNYETIETKAQIHNVDNIEKEVLKSKETFTDESQTDEKINHLNGHISGSSSSSSSSVSLNDIEQNKSLTVINAVSEQSQSQSQSHQRVQSPTGKLKSHSLSDLTINNSDKSQSALLERAVSLDMNAQNLPEENLYHHGKNLLATNQDENDSMPTLNWYNKQTCIINSDSNSSVSTLNETNQMNIKNETHMNGFEQSVNGDIFKFETQPQNASTPLKLSNSAIDQYINLDVSSLEKYREDTTLIQNNNNTDSPDLPQLIENSGKIDDKNKEIIEISRAELDDVMMSHKTFLDKRAKLAAPQMVISPVTISKEVEPENAAALDFESWSYISDDGSFNNTNNNNPIKSDNESTLYTTALDNTCTLNKNSQDSTLEHRKLPEIAGITLKTSENGQLNTSLFKDNDESPNSSLG